MRKTYGPGYPRTLGALMAWSGLDSEAPAVTDAAGTLDRRAFEIRVLRFAAGLRRGGVGSGSRVALWLPNGSGKERALSRKQETPLRMVADWADRFECIKGAALYEA